eukprot:CAMPEP_0178455260 /NCGR_PEP_ID=MMETSP0689_2-20121128/45812_1 /TAXON_ID=160604 /ORGANISM="Amphidinium massartii, Strain CS-259" /LENGTH=41 /DNA_ID= /DNA_START= /DNA_END= /DNA_ORIENTATION=
MPSWEMRHRPVWVCAPLGAAPSPSPAYDTNSTRPLQLDVVT